MTITTTNPATGVTTDTPLHPSSAGEVHDAVTRARAAAPKTARLCRAERANLLDRIADVIESRRDDLVSTAAAETGLTTARLDGEISRSAFQFRLFADAVREGSYLEAAIDHAAQTALGPQPDVRRLLVPVGPVAVFGSSNFPFAFSVLGGDVASALAAGSPVVAKAHSSHPLTSRVSFDALRQAAVDAGAPDGTVGIVYGQAAGTALVQSPEIAAVGFTGSLGAAQALQAAISERESPIPFFGELSSINPLIVTEAAAVARTSEIAQGLFGSYTGSGGQLCTKPGIAFIPRCPVGDALVEELAALTSQAESAVLLNSRIRSSFHAIEASLNRAGASRLSRGRDDSGEGFTVAPTLLVTDASHIDASTAEECFGPLLVVARYDSIDDVIAALRRVPRSLTLTVHAEDADADVVSGLFEDLGDVAGRLVYNGYPTGVRVSWAQTHGGPWPATNTQFTSVGVSSLRRWLRPVSWQNAPQAVLPAELRDGPVDVPRRVDGRLILPDSTRPVDHEDARRN